MLNQGLYHSTGNLMQQLIVESTDYVHSKQNSALQAVQTSYYIYRLSKGGYMYEYVCLYL